MQDEKGTEIEIAIEERQTNRVFVQLFCLTKSA